MLSLYAILINLVDLLTYAQRAVAVPASLLGVAIFELIYYAGAAAFAYFAFREFKAIEVDLA